jgi:type I restriction enzyme, S subunit
MSLHVVNGHKSELQGIPADWTKAKMRRAVGKYQLEKNEDSNPVVLSLTKAGVRVKTDLAFGKSTDNYVGHQIVEPGQFVFTPRDFDATPILCGLSPTRGCISNLYLVFDVAEDIHPRFLEYYFWGLKHGYDYFAKLSHGMRFSFNREQFERIPFVFPCRASQAAIVTYLDSETRRIDDLIEEKYSFITLLQEKRVAEISRAVTKGISLGTSMKPSEVEWLSEVPAHWDTMRLGVIFKEADRRGDPTHPVLSVSIHDGVSDKEVADEDRVRKVALSEDRNVYQGVMPGDLVYNMMRAWQGGFGAVTTEGLVSPAYVVARPLSDARTKFIELQLRTPQAVEEMRRYSKGIADFRMRLYWEHFRNVRVALPSLEEQDAILANIDRETTRIDGLIHETEHSIALLKEKRAALITAAVTGKIDVRNAA